MNKKLIYCVISILIITIFTACTPAQRPLDDNNLRNNGILDNKNGNIFDNNNGNNNQNNRMNNDGYNALPDNNSYID